jgi:CBS domain-containing protein
LLDEQNRLAGIVTRGDLLRSLQRDPSGKTLAVDAGSAKPIVAFPDELLREAVERMIQNDIGRLPVVDREDHGRILGYLGRTSVMLARSRHLEEEELREKASLSDLLPIRS